MEFEPFNLIKNLQKDEIFFFIFSLPKFVNDQKQVYGRYPPY